jgi:hypothetical protein
MVMPAPPLDLSIDELEIVAARIRREVMRRFVAEVLRHALLPGSEHQMGKRGQERLQALLLAVQAEMDDPVARPDYADLRRTVEIEAAELRHISRRNGVTAWTEEAMADVFRIIEAIIVRRHRREPNGHYQPPLPGLLGG